MGRERGLSQTDERRRRSQDRAHRIAQALICALALSVVSGTLLWSQPVSAAKRSTFYGIPDSSIIAAAATDTTTAATATDTPIAPTNTPTATPLPTSTNTPAATATPGNPNVLNVSAAATAAGWPQSYSNWCGIATVALVANYLGHSVSQSSIMNMLSDVNSQSMWSYPPPSSSYWGPYVAADISGDFGTDPRSLAKGMTMATGRLYHVKVDTSGAWDTTIHIVRDMLASRQPISVFVDHGMHSVIVSGVEATGDPVSDPNSITALHVWDPGGGINNVGIQSTQEAVVSKSMWLSGTIPWSGAVYFKYSYNANVYSGKALDPDPAVGPYAYLPSQGNHLWIGHFVYISPLASADSANLSSDWELNQYGTLIAGLDSQTWPGLPDGYTGASVPMPTNPPPPPPPVKPPVIAPKPKPLPPPRPTPTPRATATSTPLPTATSLPTAVPTATSAPKPACEGLGCALGVMQEDTGLLLVSLFLLLLVVMWFPGAILVARARGFEGFGARKTKEEMLAALAASDLAASDAPTLTDLAMPGDMLPDTSDEQPTGQLNALFTSASDDSLATSPTDTPTDAPTDTPTDALAGTPHDAPDDAPDAMGVSDSPSTPLDALDDTLKHDVDGMAGAMAEDALGDEPPIAPLETSETPVEETASEADGSGSGDVSDASDPID